MREPGADLRVLRKLFWPAFWLVTAAGVAANAVLAATNPMWRQALLGVAATLALLVVGTTVGCGLVLLWKRLVLDGPLADQDDPGTSD